MRKRQPSTNSQGSHGGFLRDSSVDSAGGSSVRRSVKEPVKPKQFTLADLAKYSSSIHKKDLNHKQFKSMFNGKYLRQY